MTIRTISRNTTKISRGRPIVASKKPTSGNKKDKGKGKEKKKEKEENIIRGKEVTIREAASPGQVIYGKAKVGGVVTFITTSQESRAYLVTGDEASSNQAVWTAVATGEAGNAITIELRIVNNSPSVSVGVVGNAITVTLKSTGMTPTSTLSEVMVAVQASGAASALVTIQKSFAGTNGIVAAVGLTSLNYGGGTWLKQFITLACHQITEITKVWCDGELVTFGSTPDLRWGTGLWAGKIFMAVQYGTDDQTVQGDLAGQCPGVWRDTDRQRGCAGVTVIHVYDPTVYPEGYPELSFEIRGKPVYDPRTATTVYSENGALILADMIANTKYGLGSTLPCPTLSIAADICDESVTINSGSEARYRICGAFDTSDGPEKIIAEMEAAIAGKCYERDGDLVIHPGHYVGVLAATFTEADLAGAVEINTHWGKDDSFNGARGTFVDPTQDYNETDIAPVVNSTYLSEDGGVRQWQDFTLNFVPSQTQAQRILKIRLEEIRQGISISLKLKLVGLKAYIGSRIALTLAEFGWTSKMFEVLDSDIVVQNETVTTIEIEAIETASGIFDWNNGEETTVDLADNTDLPSASDVPEPENVLLESGTDQLDKRQDGTIFSRLKVSWDLSSSEFVNFNGGTKIEYKKTTDIAWQSVSPLPGGVTFYRILDVQDGAAYDVRVRHFNILGVESDWVQPTAHTVIGKSAAPSDVPSFGVSLNDFGINLSWEAIPDLDADEYEIRVGASYDAGVYVYRGRGTTFRWEHKAAGTYNFWIKAYDTSLNASANAIQADLTISAPTTPTVTATIDGPNLKLTWTASTGNFAIKEYEIRYGADYASGTVVGIATTNNHTLRVGWGGARTFFVAARDISSNTGSAGSVLVTIENPNPAQSFAVKAVGNNILLDWKAPLASTLPIAEYHVYKGETYVSSILLGVVYGTFHTYVEQLGGTFGYHVLAVDTAGNFSSVVSFTATITVPDNFYIKSQLELVNSGDSAIIDESLWNAIRVEIVPGQPAEQIFFPTASTGPGASLPWMTHFVAGGGVEETWEEWWDNNGWTTWQDAIDYDDLVFPTPTNTGPGHIEWTVDYTVTFSESFIDFLFNVEALGEGATITPSISISTDGVTYTTYSGATQLFAENFRYVKYRIDFQALDNKSLLRLSEATARISLSLDEETQDIQCFAADHASDGTLGYFTKDYLDVEDIQATPTGLVFGVAVVNFDDDPNPESFRVLLFDSEGDPMDGWVNIRIRGAVNP
jgi:hypothetical protein